jgi:DNA-binding transcriptional LysR family regulator
MREDRSTLPSMEWLNYHHLLYFWSVVRTGSVAAASAELRLAPPTISVQIRRLEEQLGEKLLRRSGRRVIPTEMGQAVFRYADDIFSLGRELVDMVRGRPSSRPMQLIVGVVDVLPKSIAHLLIEPALHLGEKVRLICREADPEQLLAQLSMQSLDVVLADAPIGPSVKVRAYNHLLGETGVSFLASAALAKTFRRLPPRRSPVAAGHKYRDPPEHRPMAGQHRRPARHHRGVRGFRASLGVRRSGARHLSGGNGAREAGEALASCSAPGSHRCGARSLLRHLRRASSEASGRRGNLRHRATRALRPEVTSTPSN